MIGKRVMILMMTIDQMMGADIQTNTSTCDKTFKYTEADMRADL